MKKTILAVFFSLFILTSANADLGVNVGVSAQIGEMTAKGKETNSIGLTEQGDAEEAIFGAAGFFIEKDLSFLPGPLARISIGYDNILHDLDLGTATNHRTENLTAGGK